MTFSTNHISLLSHRVSQQKKTNKKKTSRGNKPVHNCSSPLSSEIELFFNTLLLLSREKYSNITKSWTNEWPEMSELDFLEIIIFSQEELLF